MINASETSTSQMSFHLYNAMLRPTSYILPENYTFNFLVRACAKMMPLDTGASVHAALSNTGNDPYIQEGLTSVDSEFCYMSLVWWKFLTSRVILGLPVFDNMLCRDIFAWNVMILATLRDILEEVLNFFQSMQNEGVKADFLCFWFYQRVPSWVD